MSLQGVHISIVIARKGNHPPPPHVIARSPYFGRRGNLRTPMPPYSPTVIARKGVFCPDVAISDIQCVLGERKTEIATGHHRGPRNDEGEKGRVFAMTVPGSPHIPYYVIARRDGFCPDAAISGT